MAMNDEETVALLREGILLEKPMVLEIHLNMLVQNQRELQLNKWVLDGRIHLSLEKF
jgi:hypothetical protein